MKRPHLGNSNVNLQGFMQNGNAVSMALTGWINAPKERENDPSVQSAIEQIAGIMQQHNLSIGLQVSARSGDDPKQWPRLGSWRLFTNKPRDNRQQYNQAPARQYNQAPASSTGDFLNDEIQF
jgi:hypothetical protein